MEETGKIAEYPPSIRKEYGMNKKKRSTIFGAALVILGVLAGMKWGVFPRLDIGWQKDPLLRLPQGGIQKPTKATISPEPTVPAGPAKPVGVIFEQADRKKVSMQYGQGCVSRPDVTELLLQPLHWDLTTQEPTVLIIHTHATESYTKLPGQGYAQTTEYRTLDTQYNMVKLGDLLTELLQEAGITVLHDRTLHDYPSYNSSYTNSRTSVEAYLQQYPSIRVVLDLHRDAVLDSNGGQYAPAVTVDGKKVARMMLVVGTDDSGMHHPHWRDNLAFAVKLQVLLEQQVPGITRPTLLRAQRFNHDLSRGALIVEMGAAGNTLPEALEAIPFLAQALIALSRGTTANSTN
jgi:stage II sporulation protein P